MALGKKTGGRKKGSRNKASAEREAVVAASGLTPLDYLLTTLRDAKADPRDRFDAAKAAAPYIHPRLASIEHSGEIKRPRDMTDEDLMIVAARAQGAG